MAMIGRSENGSGGNVSVERSNRNPLDDVPGHLFLPAVVKPCRPRVGMAGQVLHVFQRHALGQQVRDRRHAERVGRQVRRQAGGAKPALHHSAHVDVADRLVGEPPGAAGRRAKERARPRLRLPVNAVEIGKQALLQIAANRDEP